MLMVKHLENGTVIDHIDAGKGMDVYNIIGVEDQVAILAINVSSQKLGKKDILKLENTYLDGNTLNIISLIAPNATINIIKDGKIIEKRKVELPKEIYGLLKCLNPNCITNTPREPLQTKFLVSKNPIKLVCIYCNTEYDKPVLLRQKS